jgi:hypothetical protein
MVNLRLVITAIALLGVSSLFGASLYDAVVLAPNLRGGPSGLEHGRLFMAEATPANLFRVMSPLTQLLLFAAVVANWKSRRSRWPLLGAFLALVLCDVITFTYHYPRLDLMFTAPLTVESDRLMLAAQQWASANLVRVALLLGIWVSSVVALMQLAVQQQSRPRG